MSFIAHKDKGIHSVSLFFFYLNHLNISSSILIVSLAALLVGISKAGLKGLGFIIVTLYALVYEARHSTGMLLPLLIFADCFAVYYYRNFIVWKHLIRIMPTMVIGVLIGVYYGHHISSEGYKRTLAIIIIFSGSMMIFFDRLNKDYIPQNKAFAWFLGLGAGFTTMVGNLAGAFSNLYFLAMRFPKNEFIGTTAFMFFILNIFKLPFHVFVWKTLDKEAFLEILYFYPLVVLGFLIGIKIVGYFSNEFFKNYIIAVTIIGAIIIFFKS